MPTRYSEDGKTLLHYCEEESGTVIIPDGVVNIASFAFNLSKMTALILPESLEVLAPCALQVCTQLRELHIPKNVREIGEGCLLACEVLEKITVDEQNPVYMSPAGSNVIIHKATMQVVEGCNGSVLPEGVVSVRRHAFWKLPLLKEVVFPTTLREIGFGAFSGCAGLTTLIIPATLLKIGREAFASPNISKIQVDANNPVYDSRNDCNAIICTENDSLVRGCCNTVIPEGVVEIRDNAFMYARQLSSIAIPSSVRKIGREAFFLCRELANVDFGEFGCPGPYPCSIDHCAFFKCAFKQVSFAHGATIEIHPEAFDLDVLRTIMPHARWHSTRNVWSVANSAMMLLSNINEHLHDCKLKFGAVDITFEGKKQWVYVYAVLLRFNKDAQDNQVIASAKHFCKILNELALIDPSIVPTSEAALSGELNEVENWEDDIEQWKLADRVSNRLLRDKKRNSNLIKGKIIANEVYQYLKSIEEADIPPVFWLLSPNND